jgi:hypothetical protein
VSPPQCHGQRFSGQRLAEPAPHRPGNRHALVEVQYHGQIQPAFCGPDIRVSRTCAPFRSCDQRFRTPSRRTGHAFFAMHPALQQTW